MSSPDPQPVRADAVQVARNYYNSEDADRFYSIIWGGEDIHIGVYESEEESIFDASRRTVNLMISKLPPVSSDTHVLDLGSGYCGAARHLASTLGVRVTALNLSEVENERARSLNADADLADRISVIDGSFETLPFEAGSFDVVWSQDAILHSERRVQVLAEVHRVLKPGGRFVFTDPMQADGCPDGVLQPILDRIHLSSLGSPAYYQQAGEATGFQVVEFDDRTPQLVMHYTRVLQETERRGRDLAGKVSDEYQQKMKAGLQRWIDGGNAGHLAWGIFHFLKG